MENPINANPDPRSEAKSPSPKAVSVFVSRGSTGLPVIKSNSTKTKPVVVKERYARVEHEDPIGGEWRRGKVLGEGSLGHVHMAFITELRVPSFKEFPPVVSVRSISLEIFRRFIENEKLILLIFRSCPYILQFLGHDEILAEDGASRLYLFLELASGGTLSSLIEASKGRIEESLVRRHTRSILGGLKVIHDEGYVHCGLFVHNIYLAEEGGEMVAKVADFGLVKKVGGEKDSPIGSWTPECWKHHEQQ